MTDRPSLSKGTNTFLIIYRTYLYAAKFLLGDIILFINHYFCSLRIDLFPHLLTEKGAIKQLREKFLAKKIFIKCFSECFLPSTCSAVFLFPSHARAKGPKGKPWAVAVAATLARCKYAWVAPGSTSRWAGRGSWDGSPMASPGAPVVLLWRLTTF